MRRSRCNQDDGHHPAKKRPRKTVTTPKISSSRRWCVLSALPTSPKSAPKLTYKTAKPNTKAREPTNARPRPDLPSSVPVAPLKKATEPGSSGRTHGEANEIKPAAKARGKSTNSDAGNVAITAPPPAGTPGCRD